MTKSRGLKRPKHVFSSIDDELLRRNYADSLTSDLATVLGCSVDAVLRRANRLGLKKSRELVAQVARERMLDPTHPGRAYLLKPGNVPSNKGKKMPPGWAPGRMAESQFKKGNKPHTWVPVGSYRISPDGYLERKVNDLPGNNSVRWHPVHRLVWEEVNGPVPAGHMVAFKPGRRTTELKLITLDAVELISRAQNMARNTIHNQPGPVRELMRLRGTLTRAINRRVKEQGA